MIIRHLIRKIYRKPADGDGGDLGASATAAFDATPAAPAEGQAAAPAAPAAPTTMAEAMWNRDEMGRFAPKTGDAPAAAQAPGAPAAPAAAVPAATTPPAQPAKPDDITAMPEGLGAKAQERFQTLANGIKERDAKITELTESVGYVQQQFQQHGVQQEQFEQAVGVIGMLNRGDYRGALQVLDEQRRQIALAIGEPLPGVDALQGHADLRQAVDGLQITEQHALEIARARNTQQAQQQHQQAQQQAQQSQQREQQAVQQAQAAVDTWWKQMAATDLDAPAIEKILLPKLGQLLQGVPPTQWAGLVQTQYNLIKESVGAFRQPAPTPAAPAPSPLRATGQAGAVGKPSSMHEAMWGRASQA